jgi:hypothetical protein
VASSHLTTKTSKSWFRGIIENVKYEFAVNILSILNLLALSIKEDRSAGDQSFVIAWVISQIVINAFFLLEMVGEWYAFGFKASYKRSFRCTTETVS